MEQIITGKFNTWGMINCKGCNVWYRKEEYLENQYLISHDYTGEMGTCGIASCDHYGIRLCVECLMCGTEVELTDLVCTEHYVIGKKLMLKRLDRAEIL